MKGMRKCWTAGTLAIVLALAARPALATLIHVDAQATYTGSNARVLTIIPAGTVVTASLQFDIGPGAYWPPPNPTLSGGTGSFTWENGGPQVFNISGIQYGATHSAGWIGFGALGTGPTIGGITVARFSVRIGIAENPFTSTQELSDLVLAGSVLDFSVGAKDGSLTTFDAIVTNVSGTITGVHEPASLLLLGLGLAGLGARWQPIPRMLRKISDAAV